MKKKCIINYFFVFIICIFSFSASCSGIKLPDNCGKNNKKTFIVLPFVDDEYACYLNVEDKIRNLCYDVESGVSLMNEYSVLVSKSFDNIDITEFCDYAKSKGIDYVVVGTAKVEWHEGRKSTGSIIEADGNYRIDQEGTYKSSQPKSSDAQMYNIITGNYAVVNCRYINTETKDIKELFHNYKVKKVQLGMSSSF